MASGPTGQEEGACCIVLEKPALQADGALHSHPTASLQGRGWSLWMGPAMPPAASPEERGGGGGGAVGSQRTQRSGRPAFKELATICIFALIPVQGPFSENKKEAICLQGRRHL